MCYFTKGFWVAVWFGWIGYVKLMLAYLKLLGTIRHRYTDALDSNATDVAKLPFFGHFWIWRKTCIVCSPFACLLSLSKPDVRR